LCFIVSAARRDNRFGPDPLDMAALTAQSVAQNAVLTPRDPIASIERLTDLRAKGSLSDAEFEAMKVQAISQAREPLKTPGIANKTIITTVIITAMIVVIIFISYISNNSILNDKHAEDENVVKHTQNDNYFVKERFSNPRVLQWLYESNFDAINNVPANARLPIAAYISFTGQELAESCGSFLTTASKIKQGAFTIGLAINSVSSIPKDTDNALGEWLTNFGSLENIEKHSRREMFVSF
jgi:hypothetical protein